MKTVRASGANDTAADPGTDLAGALHEVSNTLTVVLGWLDDARSRLPQGGTRDALEVAYAHARRGHAITRRAIGASTDEAAQTRSAVSLAQDAVVAVSQEAARKSVSVRIDDRNANDLLMRGAPVALQVLINLLFNAIQFSPSGSTVVLRVRNDPRGTIFDVIDAGPGIAPERVETLFTGGESSRPGGAGVGLRHSHALAHAHGGDLRLAETGPSGSRFELRWPMGEAPSGALHRSVPAPSSLGGTRVLVLEDDAAVQSLIEFGLTARGAQVASAGNLQDLDLALQRGVFDLVLVDLSPIADDPAAALDRLSQRVPGLPLVVISGATGVDVDPSRVAAWVRKPFEVSELVDVVRRVRDGE